LYYAARLKVVSSQAARASAEIRSRTGHLSGLHLHFLKIQAGRLGGFLRFQ